MGKDLASDVEIITIEILRDEAEAAGRNIGETHIPPKVTIIAGDAIEVVPTLKGKFDLAFLHAEKTEYFQYLKLAEAKLNQGTVGVADNA